MNHMQMTPELKLHLWGKGMGTPAPAETNTGPLWTPYPARSKAGRDRADFKAEQWAGTIYKLSRKIHSHTHKATTSLFPHAPQIFRQGLRSSDDRDSLFPGVSLAKGSHPSLLPSHLGPLFIFCSPGPGLQEFSKASPPQEGVRKLTWESLGQVEVTSSSAALQNPRPALLGPEFV